MGRPARVEIRVGGHLPTAADDPLVPRLERALRRFRLQTAHNLLDEALAARSAGAFVNGIATPVLARLDDPAAARLGRSLLEQRLLAQARGWQAVDGPLVTLACAPADEHVLELIALGIDIAQRGCRIAYLGPATPPAELRHAADAQDAAVVVLGADHPALTAAQRAELTALGLERPLFVLGAAREAVARLVGATALEGAGVAARVAGIARQASPPRAAALPARPGR
jgi:hypothetical protein